MRKTKIICTIGPASSDEKTLRELCLAGMNVARLNFSHGTHEGHKVVIDRIKAIRKELGLPVAIMQDTKGPEYRIGQFKAGKVMLKDGDKFAFTTREVEGDESIVSVSYKQLAHDIRVGDIIYVNDGLVKFEVKDKTETDIFCDVVIGGEISNRKSMSFPNKVLNQVYLSEQDKADILFGIANDVDFIACSFVSRKQDLVDVRTFLNAHGGENIDIIAKIENRSGLDNIDEICEACEGIMIARGDLGVEIPFEELPSAQKFLTTKCRMLGKRVITATEMLESMINKPRPTRAEISDVANAVYDGTSAIMLSGETAAGKYPVITLKTMSKIAEYTEQKIDYKQVYRNREFTITDPLDAISHSAVGMAIDLQAKAIVVTTVSGKTARMVSRFRGPVHIIGLTAVEKTWHKLAMSWGIVPRKIEPVSTQKEQFKLAREHAKEVFGLTKGDRIIITSGMKMNVPDQTTLLKVETL